MTSSITLGRRIEILQAEHKALGLSLEQRKEAFDRRIHGKEQPLRAEMWREFLAANERDLIRHIQLSQLIDRLTP